MVANAKQSNVRGSEVKTEEKSIFTLSMFIVHTKCTVFFSFLPSFSPAKKAYSFVNFLTKENVFPLITQKEKLHAFYRSSMKVFFGRRRVVLSCYIVTFVWVGCTVGALELQLPSIYRRC